MTTLEKIKLTFAALAVTMLLVPFGASAQECAARVTPAELEPGAKAVAVTVTVSEAIGAVTGVQAPEASGISLALPNDLPRTEMAATGAPHPIKLGEGENVWIIWLNVENAEPGTHAVAFTAAEGRCSGNIVIAS